MDWTRIVWRALCLLAATSAVLPFTPVWFLLGPIWQGVAVAPVLIFALVIVIAQLASSAAPSSSCAESAHERVGSRSDDGHDTACNGEPDRRNPCRASGTSDQEVHGVSASGTAFKLGASLLR